MRLAIEWLFATQNILVPPCPHSRVTVVRLNLSKVSFQRTKVWHPTQQELERRLLLSYVLRVIVSGAYLLIRIRKNILRVSV